ncbi:hypothetical protein BD289DRAFT_376243 [Coniella lustricola]|uniref:RRM domain-containing protein n=1 Tax=Coniella lustricola TaxID=2025994 RepID=A0A2T2ZX26_9PEZI|nr:hypothetical protein BD289DRAFT_376243 [Coniella lustricola]
MDKAEETPVSKSKKGKASVETTTKTASSKKESTKAPKSAKKLEKKAETAVVDEEAVSAQDDVEASSDEEVDEQTQALVQTVDSGDDDEPASGVVLFEEGQDVGKIPALSNKERKAAKKALAAAKAKEETGVIYVGRLPHGFYEHEMKSYFSQFGAIRNLRLSRNKKTGRAKHFAFVEFEELSTAEIVAKTMDNYLLFGHILKCSVIPKAQVHDDLFKGGNKRFKPVPWNKMEGKQMERPLLEDKWARKINKEKKRRADRAKKLEAIGYDFAAPELLSVEAIPAIAAPEVAKVESVDASTETPVKAIMSAAAEETVEGEKEEDATPKTVKRSRGRPSKAPQKAGKADTPKKAKK